MIDIFANRLKKLRNEKGISQEHLAYHMDVSRSTVANWECGTRYPAPGTIRNLALFFNVSSDYICGRTAERRNIVISPMNGMNLTRLNVNGLRMLAEYYRLLVNDDKYKA